MSITQARIAGINVPMKKKLFMSLSYVYGIGKFSAVKICNELKLDPNAYVHQLSEADISLLRKYIDTNYTVEGDLRSLVSSNIKRLISIGCYRGIRHRKRLPVRGQRTRTNARTRKGRKSSPIAGKKKVTK